MDLKPFKHVLVTGIETPEIKDCKVEQGFKLIYLLFFSTCVIICCSLSSICRHFWQMDTTKSEGTDCKEVLAYSCKEYRLHDVEFSGRHIGHGAHTSVVEMRYQGLTCAAKKFHFPSSNSNLPSKSMVEVEDIEHNKCCYNLCKLLGQLRHPNVVQFLGFYSKHEKSAPFFVFEYLHTSLAKYLEMNVASIPEGIAVSIMKDVATALRYLHGRSMPITLQNSLTASQVLLSINMTAKLANVGVNYISEAVTADSTKKPRLLGKVVADIKLKNDIYFFGLLVLQLVTRKSPLAELIEYYYLNSSCSIIEVDVVKKLLGEVHDKHPLLGLIKQSLAIPQARPNIVTVQQTISHISLKYPPLVLNSSRILRKTNTNKEEQLNHENGIEKLLPSQFEETVQFEETKLLKKLLHQVLEEKVLLQDKLNTRFESKLLENDSSVEVEAKIVGPGRQLNRQSKSITNDSMDVSNVAIIN